MIKVMVIGPNVPYGGVARYVRDLLDHQGKYQFTAFNTARPRKKRAKAASGYSGLLDAGLLRALQGVLITLGHMVAFPFGLLRSGAYLVHVCGNSYHLFWENAYYILVSRLLGRPVTLHFLGAFDLYYTGCSRLEQTLVRMVLHWPRRVIVLSQKVDRLMATFLSGQCLALIPSSVNSTEFIPSESKPSNKDGIIRVLFMGGFGGADPFRKGAYDLLEAACSVVQTNPNVRFIVSGSESTKPVIRRWCELGLEHFMEFVGWIPEDQKARMYQEADILALPSHNEGLPYVIIEALASGLPIVATSVGGIPEVVIHGENGYIFEPCDTRALANYLRLLVNDQGLRQNMSMHNRIRAEEQYSLSATLGRLEAIFDDVLGLSTID
jgi:glycosyltransferase involved in cell wall biosynthesis